MTGNSSSVHRLFSFGPYTLDPMRRLLWRDGALVALTPKTVDVLSVLVERHGAIVEKDDLLRFVWPNAVVEENNLARHISTLRKALQQRRGQHDFISTIPGRGYMFVAAVTELVDVPQVPGPGTTLAEQSEPANGSIPSVVATQPALSTGLTVAACLLLAAVAGLAWYVTRPQRGNVPRTELRQLTFDPGLQRDPTWSPDGQWLAYAADRSGNLDLYRRSMTDPTPVALTTDPADDSQPDWSPDGQWIAFRSERDGGGIYVMPSGGGPAERIAPVGFFPRWSPDSSRLLFRGSMLRGIGSGAFVVNRDGSHLAAVRPDLLRQFDAPHVGWFPDGKRISIAGRRDRASLSPWTFLTAPIDGHSSLTSPSSAALAGELEEQQVTLGRFVWSRSARFLYFEGRSADAQSIWRIAVDPGSLAWKSAPERITTSPADYADVALSPDATRLAFSVRHDKTRIWSFPFSPSSGTLTGDGQPVTPGGPAEYDAAAPLDGSKVAYRTVRGGRQELWQRSASGDGERLLASGSGATRTSPRWSRDGTRLAYMRRNVGASAAPVANAIAIIPAGGGTEQLLNLPPETVVVPDDWSSDGSWILAACKQSSRQPMGTCLIPSSMRGVRDLRVVAADPARSLMCQRFSPDERWISFMAVDSGQRDVSTIYVMPATGGAWIPITDGASYDDKPRWSPDGRAIYFLSARDGALNLWGRRFDPSAGTTVGAPFRATSFRGTGPTVARELARVEIAISSDRLFLPMTESAGTIWMVEGVDR
jgi:Tol biopolymer transport system component/DNA-binding winged helix-turn-helix (wHTH) protein